MTGLLVLFLLIAVALIVACTVFVILCHRAIRDIRIIAEATERTASAIAYLSQLLQESNRRSFYQRGSVSLIAGEFAVKLAAAILIPLLVNPLTYVVSELFSPIHFETAPGEQRGLHLDDGSIVHLNSKTSVSVTVDPLTRSVQLDSGEARFNVEKDRLRPFVVTTPHLTVRVHGTIFNVRTGGPGTEVAVLEGRVEVSTRTAAAPFGQKNSSMDRSLRTEQRLILRAGDSAFVNAQGRLTRNSGMTVERVLAHSRGWPKLFLTFDGEPLGDVVAEFNRYNEHRIRFVDEKLGAQPIGGILNVYEPESLLEMLRLVGVRIETDASGTVWLSQQHGATDEDVLSTARPAGLK